MRLAGARPPVRPRALHVQAGLAWTDRPAISFQFHPEFSPAFAKALIQRRYDVVPDPDTAIASLDAPNDNGRVGRWIRNFLNGEHE